MKYLLIAMILFSGINLFAADWPREFSGSTCEITMFQPQIQSYKKTLLSAHTAISIIPIGKTESIYGAVWFDCQALTDYQTHVVKVKNLKVTQIIFPELSDEDTIKYSDSLKKEIPGWDISFSLEELVLSLIVFGSAEHIYCLDTWQYI
jgi:hypothetical protein